MSVCDCRTLSELSKNKPIAFAGSGGLDSCTITHWLTQKGYEVICFTADLGQPDETGIDDIGTRMRAAGAKDWIRVPLQEALAEAGMRVVQAQATYEGGYWNTTGLARHVIVREDAPHSIYNEEATSMEAIGDFDHSDPEGYLRIQSLSARAKASAKQVGDFFDTQPKQK